MKKYFLIVQNKNADSCMLVYRDTCFAIEYINFNNIYNSLVNIYMYHIPDRNLFVDIYFHMFSTLFL